MCTTARTKKVIVGLALVASIRYFILIIPTTATLLSELLFFYDVPGFAGDHSRHQRAADT